MNDTLRSLLPTSQRLSREEIQAFGAALRAGGQHGLWLAGPGTLALDRDAELPVVVWDYYAFRDRGWRFVREEGVVVVTRLESRETVAARLMEVKEPVRGSDQEPVPPVPEGDNLSVCQFGVRSRLPWLPWRSGTYLVDVAMDGVMSNRLAVHLTPGRVAERDPAVAAYLDRHQGQVVGETSFVPPLPPPAPAGWSEPRALPLPPGEGIHLGVERVGVYGPAARHLLRGSFRLRLPAGFQRHDGSAAAGRPTGAVPITLVATGNDMTGPFVSALRVPTYDRLEPGTPEALVSGHFAVDLFALDSFSKVVQTYTLWAYSGAARSEPVQTAVITMDMLR